MTKLQIEGRIIPFAVRGKPEIKNWVEAFK
jgi:hypothetical protein